MSTHHELPSSVAPAERYRAEQPGADDIQLGDQELQAVLQSDEFARLVADESFQKAMSNSAFRDALAMPVRTAGASGLAYEAAVLRMVRAGGRARALRERHERGEARDLRPRG